MGYRYGPYLSAYLPDNECYPWLSPRNWARGVNDAISAGATAKGIWSGYKVWKGGREKLEFIVNINKENTFMVLMRIKQPMQGRKLKEA